MNEDCMRALTCFSPIQACPWERIGWNVCLRVRPLAVSSWSRPGWMGAPSKTCSSIDVCVAVVVIRSGSSTSTVKNDDGISMIRRGWENKKGNVSVNSLDSDWPADRWNRVRWPLIERLGDISPLTLILRKSSCSPPPVRPSFPFLGLWLSLPESLHVSTNKLIRTVLSSCLLWHLIPSLLILIFLFNPTNPNSSFNPRNLILLSLKYPCSRISWLQQREVIWSGWCDILLPVKRNGKIAWER